MFSNLKMRTKLGISFSILIVIASVMGFVGYLGFTEIKHLNELAADAVQILNHIERIRQHEKNFMIDNSEDNKTIVRESIREICNDIKVSRDDYSEKEEQENIDEINKAFEQYHLAIERYFTMADQKIEADKKMTDVAREIIILAKTFKEDQQKQLIEVRTTASNEEKKRLIIADAANRLIKLIQETRITEKNYLIRKNTKYKEEIQQIIKQMLTLCNDMKANLIDPYNIDLLNKIEQKCDEYAKYFQNIVSIQLKKSETISTIQSTMFQVNQMGNEIILLSNNLSKNSQQTNTQLQQIIWMIKEFNQLFQSIKDVYALEVLYLFDQSTDISQQHKLIGDILNQCDLLIKKIQIDALTQKLYQIKQFISQHDQLFDSLNDLAKQQTDIESAMLTSARDIEKNTMLIREKLKSMLAEAQVQYKEKEDDKIIKTDDANQLIQMVLECRRQEKNFIIKKDENAKNQCKQIIEKIILLTNDIRSRFHKEENIESAQKVIEHITEYKNAFEKYFKGVDNQLIAEQEMIKNANHVTQLATNSRNTQKEKMNQTIHGTLIQFIIGTLAAIIIGIVLAIIITQLITKPMLKAVKIANSIAKGDITQRLNINTTDEMGMLATSLDQIPMVIEKMLSEFESIVQYIEYGQMMKRGDHTLFNGGFAELIKGSNRIIDVFIAHLNAIPVPVMIIDKDYHITFASKALGDISGKPIKELIGKKCYDVVNTNDCKTNQCACYQSMNTGQKVTNDTIASPLGKDMNISYTGVPIKMSDGTIVGAMEVVIDQTDVRQAMLISKKVNTFQDNQVAKISAMLNEVADGNMSARYFPDQGDDYTKNTQHTFDTISKALNATVAKIEKIDEFQRSEVETLSLVLHDVASGNMLKRYNVSVGDKETQGVYDNFKVISDKLNLTFDNLTEIIKRIIDYSNSLSSSSNQLSESSTRLASTAEEMSAQSSSVASSTEQMSNNINTIASASEEMSTNIVNVSTTAEQMSNNMNSVASAVEETTMSMNEIKNHASEGEKVASRATDMAHNATNVMKTLGDAAREIGEVTEVIKRIADQTNLLALNATIEAASAGDAGKGFAVVANEIKKLANQSAQAAEDITKRIEGVQGNTSEAIEVINKVADIINNINSSVGVISSAVDQQTKATNEIAMNVSEASTGVKNIAAAIEELAVGAKDMSKNASEVACGTNEVSSNIQGVNIAVSDSNKNIQFVKQAANELSKISDELHQMVAQFTV